MPCICAEIQSKEGYNGICSYHDVIGSEMDSSGLGVIVNNYSVGGIAA